jgi:hypothetical protein
MRRTHIAALLVLIVAIPAATAGLFFTSDAKPCFIDGASAYRMSDSGTADVTVRIDNTAPKPNLRLQVVDEATAADFVLVDDGDTASACQGAAAIKSIRLDPAALNADLTVTLSRAQAPYKIYVRSANFSEQDAAALFAVIWQTARKTGSEREFAERN